MAGVDLWQFVEKQKTHHFLDGWGGWGGVAFELCDLIFPSHQTLQVVEGKRDGMYGCISVIIGMLVTC